MSRETPDSSRGSRGRNVLDPELTQDYISQVSEEIEGRVTKKLSKEFNKTESRILGALSKLDEFLLNPQVRTCSVFQGASRNANSESREIHGNRSSTDPYPEGGYFPHHSGQLNSSEADMVTETYPHTSRRDCLDLGFSFRVAFWSCWPFFLRTMLSSHFTCCRTFSCSGDTVSSHRGVIFADSFNSALKGDFVAV